MKDPAADFTRSVHLPSWQTLSLALLALAAFWAQHPFHGIVHDNVLYAAQAFHAIDPTILSHDLFFMFGSQDSFTLFSPIYASAITQLGLDGATRLLAAAGQALWLLSAFLLIRMLVPKNLVWIGLLIVATYPTAYGGLKVFNVAEPFVTPRLFSEALSLLALAALLSSRGALSLLLVFAAAILHPLMAMAPAGVIVLGLFCRRSGPLVPIMAVSVATVVLLAGLGAVQVLNLPVPARIDADWADWAQARSPQLFLVEWSAGDWTLLFCNLVLVGLASIAAPPRARPMIATIFAIGVASLLVSYVGFDLLKVAFIGQVQVWRSAWLLTVFAPIGLSLVIADAMTRRNSFAPFVMSFAWASAFCSAAAGAIELPQVAVLPILILALLYLFSFKPQARIGTSTLSTCGFHVGAVALSTIAAILLTIVSHLMMKEIYVTVSASPVWAKILWLNLAPLFLLAGLPLLFMKSERIGMGVTAGAFLVLCLSLGYWDRRTDWQRYIEGEPDIAASLQLPIGPDEMVYWQRNLAGTWFALRRKSYFSHTQGSGLIFKRETAAEFIRRLSVIGNLEPSDFKNSADAKHQRLNVDIPDSFHTRNDVISACSQSGRPDVIILERNIPDLQPEMWTAPVDFVYLAHKDIASHPLGAPLTTRRVRDFFIYRCATVASL